MSESQSAEATAAPAVGGKGWGGMIPPTIAFALYLAYGASVAVLLVAGFRIYFLSAGFTVAASAAAVSVLAVAGGIGAAFATARTRKSPSPMGLLAVTEAGFGLAVVLSVGLFRLCRALYLILWPPLGHTVVGSFGMHSLLAAGLFFLPAALACATLPILSRLIVFRPDGAGLGFGFSVGLGLAGGALGAIVAGSWVLPSLGLKGSILVGLALTGLSASGFVLLRQRGMEGPGTIGLALAGGFSAPGPRQAQDACPATSGARSGVLAASVTLVAFVIWGFLLVWDRALALIIGRTLQARTVTAAVFLLGMTVGVFLCVLLADRLRSPFTPLAAILVAASLAASASMVLMPQVAVLFLKLTPLLDTPGLSQVPATLAAAALMMPTILFLGAAVPLLAQGVRCQGEPAAGVAFLFALGIVGAELVISLLAIPVFGLRRSLSLVSAVEILAAILLLIPAQMRHPTMRPTLALGLLGLLIILGAFPATWDPRLIVAGLYRYGAGSLTHFGSAEDYLEARKRVEVLFYREGNESAVMIERTLQPEAGTTPAERLVLTVDGKVEAGTGDDIRTQVFQGHIPILVHGPTENVLQIDFLDGITAGSVLRHPVKSLTVIEREPALFEASKDFASYNYSPTDDSRLVRLVDGARGRLLADPTRYDVIIVAGFSPWMPQSAALFTREGLGLLKSRLNTGGLVSLRVPFPSDTGPALRTVIRTFARTFESVLLFQISEQDLLLIGSSEPLTLDIGWFRNVLSSTSDVSRDLRRIGVRGTNEILYTFRMGGDGVQTLAAEGALNDDDRNPVEFAAARLMSVQSNIDLIREVQKSSGNIVPWLKNYGATPDERATFLYNLAKAYLGIVGDSERAQDLSRELVAQGRTVEGRWVMGEALMQQADVDGALGEWRGVLDLDPNNLDALFSLGTYFVDSRDYWKAAPYLEKAAKVHGEVSIVRYNNGRNLYYLGKNKEAIAELKEARRISLDVEKRDGYPLVDYLVGLAAHKMKSDKEAADSLETYLKWAYTQPLTRVEVDAHIKLAEAYEGIGKRFEALKQRQKGESLLHRLQKEAARPQVAGQEVLPPPEEKPAETTPAPGAMASPPQ